MDIRGPHNMRGKRVKVVNKQHYMESPPNYLARPLPGLTTPQQGNKVILWESLSAGEKEESLKVLHKEKGWVIWCKTNPKDKGEQAFRGHSQCIFTGRHKESKRDKDSLEEAPGGQHVTRARSWWKR
jgi:hypothetical protein